MDSKNIVIAVALLVVLVVGGFVFSQSMKDTEEMENQPATQMPSKDSVKTEERKVPAGAYNPTIRPEDFTTNITNKYFALPVGKKLLFDADTEEGPEKIEIEITGETKVIEGVTTLVYLDKVHLNGVLHEITRDYLAQHKTTGDVWYFGEEVDNYDAKGRLKDHAGTFIHGKDGAKAGIWMKAEQKVGDSYRQEYFKGEAEDMRDTVATGLTVKTKLGTYTDCVKVYDWTPLDKESREHKYYCPQVGALVLNEHIVTGKRSELTKVVMP